MKDKNIYLAADSGGSKTEWVLLSSDGEKLAQYHTAGLGAISSGILPVSATIKEVSKKIKVQPRSIYLSLGGPNIEEVINALKNIFKGVPVLAERESNGNAILHAASFLGCTSAVMCGTGSVAVGNTKDGRKYCGGWGSVYGDGGSGGGLGQAALRRFLRSLDKMDDIGKLADEFSQLTYGLNILKYTDRMELKNRVVNLPRYDIAALSARIYKYAENGNKAAEQLYLDAAEEIAEMANAVTDNDSAVLLCGGFFKNKPLLVKNCKKLFAKKNNSEMIYNEKFEPILAAELAVLKNSGIEITEKLFFKLLNEQATNLH